MRFIIYWSFFCLSATGFSQPRVILDADIDSDVDDVAALAMLHNLASNEKIILAGIIVTSDDPFAPLCVDAINTYFDNSEIPIGFLRKQAGLKNHSRYTRQISEEFPHKLKSYEEAWDAIALYRNILSNSPDRSVIIITIGHLTSLQELLKSAGDSLSPLTGKALAQNKVSKWICMGGMFPSGKEANFYRPDPGSTVYCLQHWKNDVIFCGWEIGKEIISGGKELQDLLSSESPVYRAFQLYNQFAGRPSWDQVAILLLMPSYKSYFESEDGGYCHVNPDGSNSWVPGRKTNQSYIKFKAGANREEIARLINNMSKK